MKKVLSIASARPNFVKLAAVHHALALRPDEFQHIIIHTGQHYDPLLSDVFFEQLKIPQPAFNLGVHGGTREEVIEATKIELLKKLPLIEPDIILVYGDVNGALGAAEAAKEAGIRLAHVEAGLRSFDLSMPEEHNRLAIDRLANILLCSEKSGVENLKKDPEVQGEIHLVGNTMIDTLMRMMPFIDQIELPSRIPLPTFVVCTIHRPSNVDSREMLEKNLHFISEIAEILPVILPAHPRLRTSMERYHLKADNIEIIEPLSYLEFLKVSSMSECIITDSGGIQEEAVWLHKRCFTLRPNTERPSTIESGSNVLIDPENVDDRQKVLEFAKNPVDPAITIPDFWDRHTGERIAGIL